MPSAISSKVYGPVFRVTLFKSVQRETIEGAEKVSVRYGSTTKTIDLTPFFTEYSTITTSKSTREAAGGFAITVADRPFTVDSGTDSLYGIVEPMDMIEIRFSHAPTSARPPVIMRGFVSNVRRPETIGQDGTPARSVVITGQDYGKLWQMLQIFYGPGYVIGQDIISAYAMYERFGSGFKIAQSGADFLTESFDKILNPYVQGIVAGNSSNPARIELKVLQNHGTTSLSGTQNQEGVLFDLFRRFLDVGVWNELFIAEDDAGVYCIYRPNPALDVNGKPIDPDTKAPVPFNPDDQDITKLVYYDLPAEDIVSIDIGRSDANIANFYWVRAPRYELNSDIYLKQSAVTASDKKTIDLTKYVNTRGDMYGIRKMEVSTEMGGDDITNSSTGLTESEKTKRDTSIMNWIASRRQILVEQNRDNVLLENGTITVRGNEHIRTGNYVKLRRGTFTAMYYIGQVDHQFSPFNRFISVLHVERGLGFVERMRKNGGKDSPYYAEMAGT